MRCPEGKLQSFDACTFITWNACRKSRHSASRVCKHLGEFAGSDAVVALQEASWYAIAGKGYQGFVVLAYFSMGSKLQILKIGEVPEKGAPCLGILHLISRISQICSRILSPQPPRS